MYINDLPSSQRHRLAKDTSFLLMIQTFLLQIKMGILWIDRLDHRFELRVIMERGGVIESVINIFCHFALFVIFSSWCVIVLHRSYSLFPIILCLFSPLLQKKSRRSLHRPVNEWRRFRCCSQWLANSITYCIWFFLKEIGRKTTNKT